ncbi:C-type lectin domain family 3 member A-like [Sycon ciliatum]|uniref:C-type lectin domain family 3 member A-like n=1 Tax=Sycon ciliatum TaxID=27933 RepID=UPI0031F64FB2
MMRLTIDLAFVLCLVSMTLADDITADKSKRYAEEYLASMAGEEIDQARQLAEERRAAGDYTTAKKVNSTSSAVGKREPRTASMTVQCCRNPRTGLLIYRYENRPMTREQARRNCRRNGGDLASPRNMQEFIVLENLIRPFTGVPGVWLFYNDFKTEGRFVDVSGRPAVINNFLEGEPNNVGPGGEDCVEMDGGTGTERNKRKGNVLDLRSRVLWKCIYVLYCNSAV